MVQPDPVVDFGKKKKQTKPFRPALESFRHPTFFFEHLFTPGSACVFLAEPWNLSFFFFPRGHAFYFPWKWRLENPVWGSRAHCCWTVGDTTAPECALPPAHTYVSLSQVAHLYAHTHLSTNSRSQIELQVTPRSGFRNGNSSVSPWLLSPLAAFSVK